jgi:hypothetical protein
MSYPIIYFPFIDAKKPRNAAIDGDSPVCTPVQVLLAFGFLFIARSGKASFNAFALSMVRSK